MAFSFFAAFSSCLASSAYESIVRENAVSDADIWPRSDGVSCVPAGGDARSRFRAVDCLRAVLKRVFLDQVSEDFGLSI